MSQVDIITLPLFMAKMPRFLMGLPSTIKGLRLSKATDKTKPLGLGICVEAAAHKNPAGLALMYQDTQLTWAQFNAWTNRIAHYLTRCGIGKGDAIVVLLENRPELMALTVACAKIGAVSALVNTSQRGKALVHSINLVQPKAAVVGEELLTAYQEVEPTLTVPKENRFYLADLDTLKQSGTGPADWKNLAHAIDWQPEHNPASTQNIFMDDPCFYVYTSGTTGMPRAVIFNHGRFMRAYGVFGFTAAKLKSSDRLYVTLPFYHATAMAVCWGSVLAGCATLVMARKFSATRFWDDIRRYDATAFGYVGELCRYLMDQPAKPTDLDNRVRLVIGNGLRINIWRAFKKRFGIDTVLELYGSSEGNVGFTNLFNFDATVGYGPLPYAIVEYDKENDQPVRDSKGFMKRVNKGGAGLLLGEISEKTPFHGYTDAKANDACIMRDVFKQGDAWFNTGDLMRDLGFKHAQFVDRLGDTFRWKGENVSTTEVELILDGFDDVSESVVYGVEIPNTNGRAGMASMRLECDESQFDFKRFLAHLREQLPHYAVPIFLRLSDAMEVTGTFKHKKAPLKEAGFDLAKQDCPVYVCLPRGDTYVRLTPEVQQGIESGLYRY